MVLANSSVKMGVELQVVIQMLIFLLFPLVLSLCRLDDLLVFNDFSLKGVLVTLFTLLYLCDLLLFQDQSYLPLDFTHEVLSCNHLSFSVWLDDFYRDVIFNCWKLSDTFDLYGT